MKNIKSFILVIILIGVALLVHQYITSPEEITSKTETSSESPIIEDEDSSDLKEETLSDKKELLTFENKTLGLSFTYPESFGTLDFEIRDGAESGKLFYGSFEKFNMWFGGVTENFSEGRGVGFTDYRGNPTWYDDKPIVKTIEVDGGIIKIIKGTGITMPGNNLIEGQYGALTSLKGKDFKGVAFATDGSLEKFESVLKTVVIK